MGKKVKTGKNRLDKYYHLAKEQGYRARSAFKLIQLAQYNDIFSNCRILLDLCAAPGGWLQVAQKNMPVSSQIIGIDLVPIKPIHGVITIQSDITSQRCLSSIKSHLQGERADVVLHDGAPNVGTSWSYDAYSQNELVLSALRIAATFLRLGGTFVTKVFRSQDYLSLLWVFQQLFARVTATKPSSSRNISAEIFVICNGYRQPEKLDTKFFDPRHVFLNFESQNSGATSLQKKNKRSLSELMKSANERHRQGYEKGNDYKETTITEFLNTEKSPAEFIMNHHKLVFDKENEEEQKLLNHPLTTQEVIFCCDDLKVLGKREVTLLLKWRHKLLKETRDIEKENLDQIKEQDLSDSDEFSESHLDEKLQTIKAEQAKLVIKEARRRRQLEEKLNLKRKMSLGGFNPVEVDRELFCLKDSNVLAEEDQVLEAGKYYDHVEKLDEVSDDLSENNESIFLQTDGHAEIDYLTEQQRLEEMAQNLNIWESQKKDRQREKDAKRQLKKKKETRRELAYAAWNKELADVANKGQLIETQVDTSDDDEEDEDVNMTTNDGTLTGKTCVTGQDTEDTQNDINIDENDNKKSEINSKIQQKTHRWFNQTLFKEAGINLDTVCDEDRNFNINNYMNKDFNVNDEDDIREINEDELVSLPLTEKQQRKEKRKRELEKKKLQSESERKTMKKKRVFDIELNNVLDSTAIKDKDCGSFTTVPRQTAVKSNEGYDEEEEEENQASVVTFAPKSQNEISKIQALGNLLSKKRTRFDLIDGAYNRYSFDDDKCVPDWFLEDEEQRMRPKLPVTKEVMKEYRQKLAELSKRPIRKVLDAQGRKKQKMRKRIQSAKNKAEVVASSAEYTEFSKAATIQKIMRNATRDTAKGKTYVASRKKGGSTTVGRNRQGEKGGKVRMVDKRLKKDKRAQKLKRKRSRR